MEAGHGVEVGSLMADTGLPALRQFSFTTRPYLAVDDGTGERRCCRGCGNRPPSMSSRPAWTARAASSRRTVMSLLRV
jgi:hypothetical protein